MNKTDNRRPLILTRAMETTRVEEVAAMVERAELDEGRLRHDGKVLAARRAEHQRRERRTDLILMTAGAVVVVAFWAIMYLALGWQGVAALVSFALLAGAVAFIGGSLWDYRHRIADVLSGRSPR